MPAMLARYRSSIDDAPSVSTSGVVKGAFVVRPQKHTLFEICVDCYPMVAVLMSWDGYASKWSTKSSTSIFSIQTIQNSSLFAHTHRYMYIYIIRIYIYICVMHMYIIQYLGGWAVPWGNYGDDRFGAALLRLGPMPAGLKGDAVGEPWLLLALSRDESPVGSQRFGWLQKEPRWQDRGTWDVLGFVGMCWDRGVNGYK